jgi:Amidase
MNIADYAQLDGVELAHLIATDEVSKEEVEAVGQNALELVDADLNALAIPVFATALDYADDGVLAGVPFVIKDSGPVERGVPFSGSRSIRRAVATHDATVMSRFRAAGLATLGSGAGSRRIERRRGGVGGGRRRPHRARQRWSEVDSRSRVVLWPRRAEADPRPHPVRA